jgi:molybdopterin converting factor small subunit
MSKIGSDKKPAEPHSEKQSMADLNSAVVETHTELNTLVVDGEDVVTAHVYGRDGIPTNATTLEEIRKKLTKLFPRNKIFVTTNNFNL